MGYNIGDVSGNSTGGPSDWTFTVDLSVPGASTVSGDFDVVPLFGGATSEATDGYTAGPLSTTAYGTLTFDTATGQFTFVVNRAAVFASGSDQVVTFTITGTSGANVDDDVITINILICFLKGTRIATPHGDVPVEDLRAGDLVLTRDGPAQPVRWIGRRCVSAAEIVADPSLRPVRIESGALGTNTPERDLVVSPQHRMFLADWRADLLFGESEVLVPAKALINDTNIRLDHNVTAPEYYHVLFDRHEVIFAEGAATESFHPGEYSISALDPEARLSLEATFPGVAVPALCGETARLSLRPWEAKCLVGQLEIFA